MDEEIKKEIEEVEQEKQEFLEEQNKKIPHEKIEDELQEIDSNKETPEEPKEEKKETPEEKPKEEKQEEKPVEEKKKEPEPKGKSGKEGSFRPIIFIMLISLAIAYFWDKLPFIKNSVHFILDPTAGSLLNWNLTIGMLIIVLIITIITTLVQKYATDQQTLKELKKESKEIQKQMKEFRSHPEKMMELQKKQFALMPKQMKLSMRAIAYTGVPFILFFRWFYDFFEIIGNPKFFGFLSWFLFYLISAIIFGIILRKQMDVV